MTDPMDGLRQVVLGDPALCRRLVEIIDRREFAAVLGALAREHEISLDSAAIEGALVAARRLWLETWV